MTQAIVFVVASVGLVSLSWRSLRHPRSHGFFRFFAWEAILGLIVLNADRWFAFPFSWNQLVSWTLLMLSAWLVVHSAILLHAHGRSNSARNDPTLYAFEKTTELLATGPYKYVRHPLYSSLLLLGWGVFFKDPSPFCGILGAAATLFLYLTARAEEAENLRYFGDSYAAYMSRTKKFLPFIF